MSRVLVVGASHAGVQVAASLRERGFAGSIDLIDEQPHLPYHRPPLSKRYLLAERPAEPQLLRSDTWFDQQHVGLRRGEVITAIDLDAARARTSTGAALAFDHLVLATGADARRLPVPGGDLPGVICLRTLDDAGVLAKTLDRVRTAVVVGGGYVGLEAAAVLRQLGVSVTVVEAADRLMARSATPQLAAHVADLHARHGVKLRLGVAVERLDGDADGVRAVVLADGTSLPADLVVVGVGIVARSELAIELGARTEGGRVVVDEGARTSLPGVLAVGDVTVSPHPLWPGVSTRLESVQNAVDQATAAACTVLDLPQPSIGAPWFWSDQYDAKLQMAGAPPDYDDVVLRGEVSSGRFSLLAYSGGRLVGAECVNSPADFVALRRALGTGVTMPADLVVDAAQPLKRLLSA